jgi:hypothetical protein
MENCQNEDECETPMWCRGKDKCQKQAESDKATGPLDAAAGSAFAWDSMSNGGKLLLLTYALLAVAARTWTETWRQADWPHELSLSTEADAFRRLTDRQNVKTVATCATGDTTEVNDA